MTRRGADAGAGARSIAGVSEVSSPTRALKVCHIIHSLEPGGAEHLLLTFARAASAASLDMSVICLMPDEGLAFADELRELDIEVVSLGLGTRWDPRGLWRGARAVAGLQPDVIHTHLKHADLVGAFASRRLGVPMVSPLHLIEESPRPVQRLKRRVAAQARLRTARMTLAVSDAQRQWYLAAFNADPRRVTTVRNGVLTPGEEVLERGPSMRRRLGIVPETVVVAMVSLMRPGKGHTDVLEAMRRVPGEVDLRLVLAGDGPLREEIENRVEADPLLRDRVVVAGFVDDVEGLLAASDFVVHASHADALPTALIYALAAGLPVIATSVGGIPEIVTPESGVLVPPHDVERLALTIEQLARDPVSRAEFGAAARLRFAQQFDAEQWVGRLRDVYVSVRAEQPGFAPSSPARRVDPRARRTLGKAAAPQDPAGGGAQPKRSHARSRRPSRQTRSVGRGFAVALIGPDGAGKSTISERLERELGLPAHRIYMGINLESSNLLLPTTRWMLEVKRRRGGRPDVAPLLARDAEAMAGRREGSKVLPWLRQLARVGTLIAEEWFRQLIILVHLRRGEIVILDRHFLFDYYAADIEPNGTVPLVRRIHGFLLRRAYPRPHLVVVLDAPAETLFERKGEGTVEWLEGRRHEYLRLRGLAPCSAVIDAGRPLDEVVAQAASVVRAHARR
jgi:glycosyltransferase involved in cell wall biosynthesis/thymidylate kinase